MAPPDQIDQALRGGGVGGWFSGARRALRNRPRNELARRRRSESWFPLESAVLAALVVVLSGEWFSPTSSAEAFAAPECTVASPSWSPRQRGRVACQVKHGKVPAAQGGQIRMNIGDSKKFVGADNDIPRHRNFDFDLWDRHRRNPVRFFALSRGLLLGCTQINRLKWPLWAMTAWTSLIVLYNFNLVNRLPHFFTPLNLPVTPFSLAAPALSLLLVFRVNGSYGRYTESRILWGDIMNRTRDLQQNAFNWFTDEKEIRKFIALVAMYPAALMCMLRNPKEHDLETEFKKQIEGENPQPFDQEMEEELKGAMNNHMGIPAPLYIINRMRQIARDADMTDQAKRLIMEQHITQLTAIVGACERVLGTPIPTGYTVHTARFLMIWLTLLPAALVKELGWATIPATYFLTYGMLGIEDVGIMLEEPFGILPLEAMCAKIGRETKAYRLTSFRREASPEARNRSSEEKVADMDAAYSKALEDYQALTALQSMASKLKATYKDGKAVHG